MDKMIGLTQRNHKCYIDKDELANVIRHRARVVVKPEAQMKKRIVASDITSVPPELEGWDQVGIEAKQNATRIRFFQPDGWNKATGAGQCIWIRIPDIERCMRPEWHTFGISGSPDDGYLEVHVGKLGDWTGRLFERAKNQKEEPFSTPTRKVRLVPSTPVTRTISML